MRSPRCIQRRDDVPQREPCTRLWGRVPPRAPNVAGILGLSLIAWTGCVQQVAGGGGSGGHGGAPAAEEGELHLDLVVHQWNSLEGIPTPPPDTTTTSCPVALPVPTPHETTLATSGICSLVTTESSAPTPWLVNQGKVKVSFQSPKEYWLSFSDEPGGCASHTSEDPVPWNEVITFEGQGDADLPAFSLDVPAPAPFVANPPPYFTAGAPYEILFPYGSADLRVQLSGAGPEGSPVVVCLPDGEGSLVIDGSLTADITPFNGRVLVTVTRQSVVSQTTSAGALIARVVQEDAFSPFVIGQ